MLKKVKENYNKRIKRLLKEYEDYSEEDIPINKYNQKINDKFNTLN